MKSFCGLEFTREFISQNFHKTHVVAAVTEENGLKTAATGVEDKNL
jgi:hypothetical protein